MGFLYGTRGPGNIRDGVRGKGMKSEYARYFPLHTYIYTCVCVCVCVCVWRKEEKIILFYLYT